MGGENDVLKKKKKYCGQPGVHRQNVNSKFMIGRVQNTCQGIRVKGNKRNESEGIQMRRVKP